MTDNLEEINKIKEIRQNFRERFYYLKKAKKELFILFRKKLEERKIEELKNTISN